MSQTRLTVNAFEEVLVGEWKEDSFVPTNLHIVTEDFLRCVVLRCSESTEFEVDGMRFRANCERID
jgi:hypothetical protein